MTKGQSLAIIESNSLLCFHNILDYFLFKGCKAYQDINNQGVILKIYLRKIMTRFSINISLQESFKNANTCIQIKQGHS